MSLPHPHPPLLPCCPFPLPPQDHCLYDLLIRHRSGELRCHIPLIVSNHPDLQPVAATFGVPFVHLPLDKNDKQAQEAQLEALLEQHAIDVVILARYMQVFTEGFCERNWQRTINIHHSFLPAFEGARPYHRAHERGVKIIGGLLLACVGHWCRGR